MDFRRFRNTFRLADLRNILRRHHHHRSITTTTTTITTLVGHPLSITGAATTLGRQEWQWHG